MLLHGSFSDHRIARLIRWIGSQGKVEQLLCGYCIIPYQILWTISTTTRKSAASGIISIMCIIDWYWLGVCVAIGDCIWSTAIAIRWVPRFLDTTIISNSLCIPFPINIWRFPKESGLPWGVERWKYWFCSFFEIWKWFAHEATNHDCPEYYMFYRDVVSFQECFIFCLAFWKRKHVYIQWFWCLQWILHCIVVHITHMYIYVYIYMTIYVYIYIYYTHYLTNLLFFHNSLCFSINMYLILNIHECILK